MIRLILSAYPKAWRRRYGDEMTALLESDRPGLGAIVDLLRGALLAHLHPLDRRPEIEIARDGITGTLACFICFCFAGSAFAKTTEDRPFQAAGDAHRLIAYAHTVVLASAIIAAISLLLAALPLTGAAAATAWRRHERALIALLAAPPLALAAFAGLTGVLAVWLRLRAGQGSGIGATLVVLWLLVGGAAAWACWRFPRAILRQIELKPSVVRFATAAMSVVAACMMVMSAATVVYLAALVADAPVLAGDPNGPGGIVSTSLSIAIVAIAMFALSATAGLKARRGARSAHAL